MKPVLRILAVVTAPVSTLLALAQPLGGAAGLLSFAILFVAVRYLMGGLGAFFLVSCAMASVASRAHGGWFSGAVLPLSCLVLRFPPPSPGKSSAVRPAIESWPRAWDPAVESARDDEP